MNELDQVPVRVSDVGVVVAVVVPHLWAPAAIEGHSHLGQVGHHVLPVRYLHREVVCSQIRGIRRLMKVDLGIAEVKLQLPWVFFQLGGKHSLVPLSGTFFVTDCDVYVVDTACSGHGVILSPSALFGLTPVEMKKLDDVGHHHFVFLVLGDPFEYPLDNVL